MTLISQNVICEIRNITLGIVNGNNSITTVILFHSNAKKFYKNWGFGLGNEVKYKYYEKRTDLIKPGKLH